MLFISPCIVFSLDLHLPSVAAVTISASHCTATRWTTLNCGTAALYSYLCIKTSMVSVGECALKGTGLYFDTVSVPSLIQTNAQAYALLLCRCPVQDYYCSHRDNQNAGHGRQGAPLTCMHAALLLQLATHRHMPCICQHQGVGACPMRSSYCDTLCTANQSHLPTGYRHGNYSAHMGPQRRSRILQWQLCRHVIKQQHFHRPLSSMPCTELCCSCCAIAC